jgi:hypothetical protein
MEQVGQEWCLASPEHEDNRVGLGFCRVGISRSSGWVGFIAGFILGPRGFGLLKLPGSDGAKFFPAGM